MTIRVECRTNAEFDACIKSGNVAVIFGLRVVAWGNSSVVARDNSSVVARDNSSVVAWGNSSVEAWGNSSVEARDNSSVEAWGNSSVEARDNSSVVARGNVLIRLFSARKIRASAYCAIYMHGKCKDIKGGKRLKVAPAPKSAKEWAEHWAVEAEKGFVTLYKGVDDDYSTDNARKVGLAYKVGQKVIAPDWDGGKDECGGGLHFSPRASMTLEFHNSATRFVACKVALKDMRKPKANDTYPQKIKARACTVIAEVRRNGQPV